MMRKAELTSSSIDVCQSQLAHPRGLQAMLCTSGGAEERCNGQKSSVSRPWGSDIHHVKAFPGISRRGCCAQVTVPYWL